MLSIMYYGHPQLAKAGGAKLVVSIPFVEYEGRVWCNTSSNLLSGSAVLQRLRDGRQFVIYRNGALANNWSPGETNNWIPEAMSAAFCCYSASEVSAGERVQLTVIVNQPLTLLYQRDREAVLCRGTYVATGLVTEATAGGRVQWDSRWRAVVIGTEPYVDLPAPVVAFLDKYESKSAGKALEVRRYKVNNVVLVEYLEWLHSSRRLSEEDVARFKNDWARGIRRVLREIGHDVGSSLKKKDAVEAVVDLELPGSELDAIEKFVSPSETTTPLMQRITDSKLVDRWGGP